MRRFGIGSAKALIWAALSPAVWWRGGAAAFAQSYDFSFTGLGNVLASGMFDVTGTPGDYKITGISGAVSGFVFPFDNGSIKSLSAVGADGNDNSFSPTSPYLDGSGVSFTVSGMETDNLKYSQASGLYTLGNINDSASGFLSVTENTPAPIPGAGWLSYLVLGFAGLLCGGPRIWRSAGIAIAPAVFP